MSRGVLACKRGYAECSAGENAEYSLAPYALDELRAATSSVGSSAARPWGHSSARSEEPEPPGVPWVSNSGLSWDEMAVETRLEATG